MRFCFGKNACSIWHVLVTRIDVVGATEPLRFSCAVVSAAHFLSGEAEHMNDQRPDAYRQPYLTLFTGVTDAIAALEACNYGQAHDFLVKAQQRAEDAFIEYGFKNEETTTETTQSGRTVGNSMTSSQTYETTPDLTEIRGGSYHTECFQMACNFRSNWRKFGVNAVFCAPKSSIFNGLRVLSVHAALSRSAGAAFTYLRKDFTKTRWNPGFISLGIFHISL